MSLEERRIKIENLYKKIESKISIIRDIRNFVNEISSLSPEDFDRRCQEKTESIKRSFSEDTRALFSKVVELYEKYEELTRQLVLKEESGDSDKELSDQRYDELEREIEEIEAEISGILKNDDVRFLMQVKKFFENISVKRRYVYMMEKLYRENPEKFWERVVSIVKGLETVDKNKIVVLFSGISINLILPEEEFNKINPNVSGFHIYGSAYNIIRDGPMKEETIRHEENHNISESLYPYFNFDFVEGIEQLKRMEKIAPDIVLNRFKEKVKKMIKNYADNFSYELIADIDAIAEEGIFTFLFKFLRLFKKAIFLIREIENTNMKSELYMALIESSKIFVEYIKKLSIIFFVVKELGTKEDIEKIKAVIVLFGPKRLSKVERYVKYLIGSLKYEIILRLHPFLGEKVYFKQIQLLLKKRRDSRKARLLEHIMGEYHPIDLFEIKFSFLSFFRLDNIKKLTTALLTLKTRNKEDYNELLKWLRGLIDEKVLIELENMDIDEIFDKDPSLLEFDTFFELYSSIKFVINELSLSILDKFIEERLPYFFFYKHYEGAIKSDNFEELEIIYNKWPDKRYLFNEVLLTIIEDGVVFEDYAVFHNKIYSKETIKESNFWRFLSKIGLDKMAEDRLK
jgi:hypothetical protein